MTGSDSGGPVWRPRLPNPRAPLPPPVPPPPDTPDTTPATGTIGTTDTTPPTAATPATDTTGTTPPTGTTGASDATPGTGTAPRAGTGAAGTTPETGTTPGTGIATGAGTGIGARGGVVHAGGDDRGPGELARHPRRPTPPAALLLLCGSGVFLFLAVAAAVIGAAAGSQGVPTFPDRTGATAAPTEPQGDYGSPEANEVYLTGRMDTVGCDAVLTSSSADAYERYIRRVTACLDRTWRSQLEQQGIDFTEPGLVISRGERPSSPCRSGASGYLPFAFYCPANGTVYYSVRSAAKLPIQRDREYLVSSPAHEYGHHVQQLTGISSAYDERFAEAYPGDVAAYTRLTRRLELQAQCFAGAFVGSNASTMSVGRERMSATAARTGDDAVRGVDDDPSLRTHGSFASNRRWLVDRGWDSRDPGQCNTWQAADDQVG